MTLDNDNLKKQFGNLLKIHKIQKSIPYHDKYERLTKENMYMLHKWITEQTWDVKEYRNKLRLIIDYFSEINDKIEKNILYGAQLDLFGEFVAIKIDKNDFTTQNISESLISCRSLLTNSTRFSSPALRAIYYRDIRSIEDEKLVSLCTEKANQTREYIESLVNIGKDPLECNIYKFVTRISGLLNDPITQGRLSDKLEELLYEFRKQKEVQTI